MRSEKLKKKLSRVFLSLLTAHLLTVPLFAAQQPDLEEQTRQIAAELRCPVCQNLSAGDSPSELAQQMRAIILQQLKEGKSPDQIKAYFVSKYGEWVLLAPTAKGFSLLIWVLPFIAVVAGIALVLFVVSRWARKKGRPQPTPVDPSLIERVQREATAETVLKVEPDTESPRSLLLQEQARLYANLRELEFDYQAGRLSEEDYRDLRHKLATEAALVLKEIEASPAGRAGAAAKTSEGKRAPAEKKALEMQKASVAGWKLAAGAIFLLLFGISVGVFLTKSIRPRASEQDTMTGDFLTGTNPGGGGNSPEAAGNDLPSLLAQGRAAYERKEWPKAIEAFKKALTIDANQPEAHTYMGLILAEAGHADGALTALDRALSVNPKFPLALWGKGMVLYRGKEDLAGARETLESLLTVMPQGAEKEEVKKTLAEISQLSSQQKQVPKQSKSGPPPGQIQQISGTISIDPKLKSKLDEQAVLFIIAHSGNSTAGPPLAVKKIDHPVFPLSYSLGPESIMMPGASLSGKVTVTVRLDKDGNPMTKEPGDLAGEYKKNPVTGGSKNVDIVLDRVM